MDSDAGLFGAGLREPADRGGACAAGVAGGEQGGTSMKPSDIWTIPLCARCHFAQHTMGEETFARKNGINMVEIAKACQRQSPHRWRWEQEE